MKLLDIIKEQWEPITDKQIKNTRLVYKAYKIGTFKPFKYADFQLKYILPDFEDVKLHHHSFGGEVLLFMDPNKIDMFIIKPEDENEGPVQIENPKDINDGGAVESIIKKLKSKFHKYNIIIDIKPRVI